MYPLLSLWVIPFPQIDPLALEIGPLAIKWYGLAYLAGLLFGWLYIRRLVQQPEIWADNRPPFEAAKVDDLLLYMTAGVVLGGRLGFVLFYEPGYYLANPLDVFAVWEGGMAFHGALIGTIIAMWIFAWRNGVSGWSTTDLSAAAVPVGLFFGRIANFINGELYGRPTDVAWGMKFPTWSSAQRQWVYDGSEVARHPSQLYEAALEGLLLFIVLRILTHHYGALKRPGLVSGTFLAGYALARSFTEELFREPHAGHAFNVGPLTAGIVYSIPMLIAGIVIVYLARARVLR
jgi:phosphatidylglycerol:prolipoprotein diacylglycerol transferase